MPRRRMRFFCSARWVSKSAMRRNGSTNACGAAGDGARGPRRQPAELGEDRLGREHDVADRDLRRRASGGEIDVDARAEADEAVALAARERVAGLHVAEDPPRDQSGDLHAGDVVAARRAQVQRIALVLERRLVERGVDEAAGVIPRVDDRAVDRAAVRVDVEHVHEHADLERVAVEVRDRAPCSTLTIRPSAGDSTALGLRGTVRGGSRKNCSDEQRRRATRARPEATAARASSSDARRRPRSRGTASPRGR